MKQEKHLHGVVVPLVSPLTKELSVDCDSLAGIIERVVQAGAFPFLLGTTGEAASLSSRQKNNLVKHSVKIVNGRCPVYAGISGNCLPESVTAAKRYAGYGADVVVAHVPSYFPLNSDMVRQYYTQLADLCPVPLIMYNIPATTHYSIPLEVIEELSHHPHIAGIKDSEQNRNRMELSLNLWRERPDFSYFMGRADQSVIALRAGADGIVPSAANFCPQLYVSLYKAVKQGDIEKARQLQETTDQINGLVQNERNLSQSLAALKALMNGMKLCRPFVMPPLCRLSSGEEEQLAGEALHVREVMRLFNLT